jgi:hypothetical protein
LITCLSKFIFVASFFKYFLFVDAIRWLKMLF